MGKLTEIFRFGKKASENMLFQMDSYTVLDKLWLAMPARFD